MRHTIIIFLGIAALAVVPVSASAMSGGKPAPAGSAPWYASLVITEGTKVEGTTVRGSRLDRAQCGGALIDMRTVITAAHCVADPSTLTSDEPRPMPPRVFRVVIGDGPLKSTQQPERAVSRIAIAPGFRILANPKEPENIGAAAGKDDIAFITLRAPVPRARTIRRAVGPPKAGRPVTLLGHGWTPAFSRSNVLLRGKLQVLGRADCAKQTFVNLDSAGMMCAQSRRPPDVQAGWGDSGGPVVTRDSGKRPRLVGILSFGTETTLAPDFTPGFNAATDVRTAVKRWPALADHLRR